MQSSSHTHKNILWPKIEIPALSNYDELFYIQNMMDAGAKGDMRSNETFFDKVANGKSNLLMDDLILNKGINFELINDIYDVLYDQDIEELDTPVNIHTNCELQNIRAGDKIRLQFYHNELNKSFQHVADTVILATGYTNQIPSFVQAIREQIKWDDTNHYHVNRNYSIDHNNQVFIQNAEMHTHGFNAADLSLCPYRNAVILNTILSRNYFHVEKDICFQHFGLPE